MKIETETFKKQKISYLQWLTLIQIYRGINDNWKKVAERL